MKKLILIMSALTFSISCASVPAVVSLTHNTYILKKIEHANKKGILIKKSGDLALYKVELSLAKDCYVIFNKDKRVTKCYGDLEKAMKKFEELTCQD